ncbi:DUF7507 domain-containing protein [Microbacterium galbinum]|uniref:DUF11 domain-containing protein n=1 Tax=Microbacterium galbinum TaxID=2851646 RepID=A0ABY4IW35_9MICO|nr:hypothetical protein [Microbacterium galbinum]UPL15698.1 hypothetical protein KV396_14950 [Microbacterium galbinum]
MTRLPNYASDQGISYTASSYWLSPVNCNGFIVSFSSARPANYCENAGQFALTTQKAYALGLLTGNAGGNRAVSMNSNGTGAGVAGVTPISANQVEFATVGQVSIPQPNRFVTFSVDAAATACGFPNPLLRFYLRTDAGVEIPVSDSPINPCVDQGTTGNLRVYPPGSNTNDPNEQVRYGTFVANSSTLLPGTSLGIVMRNQQGTDNGNDGAFDNIRVLDVTPQLDKAFSPAIAPTGGTSTLTFTITNTSELAAKNGWSFTDSLPAGLTIANPTAATTTCSSGVVTATAGGSSVAVTGNLTAGQVSCTASVQVTSPVPGTFTNGPGNVTQVGLNPPGDTTVVFQAPALTIVKDAGTPTDVNGNGITDAGDTIPFSFLVTNTGDVALTGVVVNDPKVGSVDCPATTLAVGADMTCTATYTITSEDVTAGAVLNTATATGTPPVGPPVTSPPSDTETPVVAPAPALTLVKSADVTTVTAAGQNVAYEFEVTNSGNVPVTDIAIAEGTFTGTGDLSDITCPTGPLAVGAAVTCEAAYVVTQADIDAGGFTNTATSTGTAVGTDEPVVSNDSTEDVDATQSPELEMTKSATPNTPDAYIEGQVVTYSFVVRNTGNTTVTDIVINEDEFSGTGDLSEIICGQEAATLAPDAFVTCTATYTLTQADVDAEQVTNTASATGETPGGDPVTSNEDDALIPVTPAPALTLVKSVTPDSVVAAGATVTYSFLLTNTGNVTLTDAAVNEDAFSGTGVLPEVVCPATAVSIVPGASVTCEATYVLTQADIDAGEVTNTASGEATSPTGDPVVSDPDDAVVTAEPTPGISVVKTATPDTANAVGDTISYSFLVTNTGNVTLDDIVINEGEFSGTGDLSDIVCPTAPLAPAGQVTCEATYVLTQADVDAGTVTNSATAEGTPPTGDPIESDPSDETVTIPPAASLAIVKSSDTGTITAAGQTLTYTFAVTNTGNVTVSDVVVTEVAFTGTGELSALVCLTTTVAPGDTITCEATYVVTQADVDAGSITNAATAGGEDPTGTPVEETPPSEVEVPVEQAPALTIVKSGEISGDEYVVGAEVVYSFVVTNTGNTTLTEVVINETQFSGTGELSEIICPAEQAVSLAPGGQVTCEATYALTQADIDAGEVTNTATATATPPGEDPITSTPDDALVPTPQDASVSIVKTANVQNISTAGEEIFFVFVITNTGNVTITDPEVVEGEFSGTGELSAVNCPTDVVLLPGQFVECAASYEVTQADLDTGTLTNTATATGTTPGGDPTDPSDPSTVEVPTDPQPALTVVKTADNASVVGVGQVITYTFRITNTGNISILNATVIETEFSGTGVLSAVTCAPGAASLAPGASVDCTATYRTTEADVTAGAVTNTAVASGTPITGGDPVPSNSSTIRVTLTPGPNLAVTGGEIATGVVGMALLLLIGGGVLMAVRRRREQV